MELFAAALLANSVRGFVAVVLLLCVLHTLSNALLLSAICSRRWDHLFISYLGTYGLVLGIDVKLSSSSFYT